MIKFLEEYYNYYKELEKQLIGTIDYVPIDVVNYNTFSIKYNLLYQSICSEVDVVMKELCKHIFPNKKNDNINQCRNTIAGKYPSIMSMQVTAFGINAIKPWELWANNQNPEWWGNYNSVKHDRMGFDEKTQLPNYKLANQKNVIYALSGLYVLEWYLLRIYEFTDEEVQSSLKFYAIHDKETAIERTKGQLAIKMSKCKLRIESITHLQSYFSGYEHFDYKKFMEIIDVR